MNSIEKLFQSVEAKDLALVLPLIGNQSNKILRWELRDSFDKEAKVIDFEEIKKKDDSPEKAAERFLKRLKKDSMV